MKDFLSKTWKLNRHIISDDFNKTLDVIDERIPLMYHKYPTGKQYFDWITPKKWNMKDAYIKDEHGNKVLDWKENPLHVVIGSLPINTTVTKEELLKKVYVSEDHPDLIPYVFKYYELDWGFCMAKNKRDTLKGDKFEVFIDAEYVDDYMYLGEYVIKGETDKCFIFMAHIDHPGQVNDDLAGAAVLLKIAEQLKDLKPYYTIKFQFLAERIGSIAYLSENFKHKDNIIGAAFCEMPGTPKYPLVLQHSKFKNSIIDSVFKYVLNRTKEEVKFANCFEHVINEDGVYNGPGIDIPCISISRAKPLELGKWYHFPYYHTSGDNIDNIDFNQLDKCLEVIKEVIMILDNDRVIHKNYKYVPHLSRHGLWVDFKVNPELASNIYKILYVMEDGRTIFDICEEEKLNFKEVHEFMLKLKEKGLIELKDTEDLWSKR